jgi:signal recognition particle subunit SRP72
MSPELINAPELCKHSEDLSAEEKIAELLPINVQHLYVLERLGKVDDAERVSSEIAVEKYVSSTYYWVDSD